jgi:hypothetical protein
VTEAELEASVSLHLDNLAVRTEITNAVNTYINARQFLDGLKAPPAPVPAPTEVAAPEAEQAAQ